MKYSLILPAYNEELLLAKTIDEYIGYVDEVIIVNDGSTDNTDKIAQEYAKDHPNVKYIRHETNKGKAGALRTGVNNSSGDIIIFTDADCTYPANYIVDFKRELESGADLVIGARILNLSNHSLFNLIGNRILSMLISYLGCTNIRDAQSGFRGMKKSIFKVIDVNARSLEFETKMTMRAAKFGFRISNVTIDYRVRVGKSKQKPIIDGYKMLKSIPAIFWEDSSIILKSAVIIDIILVFIGLIFGFITLYDRIVIGSIIHYYYPLITVLMILLSFQLMGFCLTIDYIINKFNRMDDKFSRIESKLIK
jgi:glycosyltransferase involved in cell wall biosynthesis